MSRRLVCSQAADVCWSVTLWDFGLTDSGPLRTENRMQFRRQYAAMRFRVFLDFLCWIFSAIHLSPRLHAIWREWYSVWWPFHEALMAFSNDGMSLPYQLLAVALSDFGWFWHDCVGTALRSANSGSAQPCPCFMEQSGRLSLSKLVDWTSHCARQGSIAPREGLHFLSKASCLMQQPLFRQALSIVPGWSCSRRSWWRTTRRLGLSRQHLTALSEASWYIITFVFGALARAFLAFCLTCILTLYLAFYLTFSFWHFIWHSVG